MLQVTTIVNKIFYSNTYILRIKDSKNIWIIDCGDVDQITSKLVDGEQVVGILLTHTHYDHVYGINKLLLLFPKAVIVTNAFGKRALFNSSDNLSIFYEDEFVLSSESNILVVKDTDLITTGDSDINVIETPGHDKSCVCYKIDKYFFSGDSYIPGHKVFCKFSNSDKINAEKSLERIKVESENMIICPGHTCF